MQFRRMEKRAGDNYGMQWGQKGQHLSSLMKDKAGRYCSVDGVQKRGGGGNWGGGVEN